MLNRRERSEISMPSGSGTTKRQETYRNFKVNSIRDTLLNIMGRGSALKSATRTFRGEARRNWWSCWKGKDSRKWKERHAWSYRKTGRCTRSGNNLRKS